MPLDLLKSDYPPRITIGSLLDGPTQATDQAAHTGVAVSQGNDLPTDRIHLASSPHTPAHYNSGMMHEHPGSSPVSPRRNDSYVLLNYRSAEKNSHRIIGANTFSTFLHTRQLTLREVTVEHLREWANTPNQCGNLPDDLVFSGAQGLCKQAVTDGLLDSARADDILACRPPIISFGALARDLANSNLSSQQKEAQVMLNYQSRYRTGHRRSAANSFLAFLHGNGKMLHEAIDQDLYDWSRLPQTSPKSTGRLPNGHQFVGAKQLCILASQLGYIPSKTAFAISACSQTPSSLPLLVREILARPDIEPKQKDVQILLNYQSTDKSGYRNRGAGNFLTFLHENGKLLNEASAEDLNNWANTPDRAGRKPNEQALLGAQNLCARARQAGYLSQESIAAIAECVASLSKPQPRLNSR